MNPPRIITIFGSYAPAPGSAEYEQAYQTGLHLGRAGFTVANGGYAGTLTELAYTWELLNKGFLTDRILVIMGDFWLPVVELLSDAQYLVKTAQDPAELPAFFV